MDKICALNSVPTISVVQRINCIYKAVDQHCKSKEQKYNVPKKTFKDILKDIPSSGYFSSII